MDAATWACAPSGVTWNGISWADVHRHVRRLQGGVNKLRYQLALGSDMLSAHEHATRIETEVSCCMAAIG